MNRTKLGRKLTFLLCCSIAASLVAATATPAETTPAASVSLASSTSSASSARWIGFYQPGAPQNKSSLTGIEAKLGMHVGVTNFFRSICQGFTPHEVENAADLDTVPLITLEFATEGQSTTVSQPSWSLSTITDGKHDAAITAYADAARDSGEEIWLRPFHEMNGDWYPWGGTVNGNSPSDFVPAWRHVHDIFVREGATNVKFVWSPNIESLPDTSDNAIARYYPGDAYVDYMALDGYNFSTTLPKVHWRSFASLFAAPYATLCSVSASKPIFVAETASVSQGGDKPTWIATMFSAIPKQFPRIVGIDWFNSGDSGRDWPVDSSSASLQSFRLGVANGTFAPGLKLSQVKTSLSIKRSASSVKRGRTVKLSGVLTPGQRHDKIRLAIKSPKGTYTFKWAGASASAGWSIRCKPAKRGTYHFRVTYRGDATRLSTASKTITVTIK